jgi:hypothetical protein
MKEPKPELIAEVEMRPDAWERFEQAVKAIVPAAKAKPGPRQPAPSVVKNARKRQLRFLG